MRQSSRDQWNNCLSISQSGLDLNALCANCIYMLAPSSVSLPFRSQSQCAEYLHPSSVSSPAAIPVRSEFFSPKSSLPVPSCACDDSDDDILSAPTPLSSLTHR